MAIVLDAVRKECEAGVQTTFNMAAGSISFLVKNFTSSPILVCLSEWDEQHSVMVGSQTAEIITSNADEFYVHGSTDTVVVKTAVKGIVEVIRND